ncbi:MAG TPA: hypothetical protein DD628_06045 [Clostridiales bacterium]|nr:hypothetical protein [Candidatus Apopatosoma intestinale]CCZ19770.1 uncharacterized protein BN766_00787 [Candidatus Apopatosoma intestinale]HBO66223.1 hypothetical protein [Candidatus Apopatosoma intestinale]
MPDNRNSSPCFGGRDTVYIDTNRILDSCRDKDCFEDVPVYLTDVGNETVDRSSNARVKCAEVVSASLSVDPVPFNRGFYHINMRIYVKIVAECCTCMGRPQDVEGIAVVDKQVILYGSEGNVNIFKSDPENNSFCPSGRLKENMSSNLPTAVLEVVDPIVLGAKIMEFCRCNPSPCGCGGNSGSCCGSVSSQPATCPGSNCITDGDMPESVCGCVSGRLCFEETGKRLLVSLGFFSVVRIERPGQFLVTGNEYTVPEKECISPNADNPCDIFKHIAFPVDEFYPPALSNIRGESGESGCGCGCGRK